ncbi:hypothetical protein NHJ13734_006049 [Beauveria thailandica]
MVSDLETLLQIIEAGNYKVVCDLKLCAVALAELCVSMSSNAIRGNDSLRFRILAYDVRTWAKSSTRSGHAFPIAP